MRFADHIEKGYSKALRHARHGSMLIHDSRLEEEQLTHVMNAALLRSDEEIQAWDAMERGEVAYVRYSSHVVEQVVPTEDMAPPMLDPHVIQHYDPNHDDNRGDYFDHEWHRTRDRAEVRCAELNEAVLQRENTYAEQTHRRNEYMFREATVLHEAGMRPAPKPVLPYEPLTVESLIARKKEHYVVKPLEFDS